MSIHRLSALLLLSISSLACFAQNKDGKVYQRAEQSPTFKYGMPGFYWFIADNLQYPEESYKKKTEGQVLVEFVVNKGGEVTDEKVVRGINEELDAEALRLMRLCPNWIPGRLTKGGEPCDVKIIMPITFRAVPPPTEESKAKSMKRREKAMRKWDKKHKNL